MWFKHRIHSWSGWWFVRFAEVEMIYAQLKQYQASSGQYIWVKRRTCLICGETQIKLRE